MRTRRALFFLKLFIWMLAGVFLTLTAVAVYLYSLSRTLPDVKIDPETIGTARTSIVFAADGTVLAEWHGEQDRKLVGFLDIPQHMRDAVIAVEDERFYEHHGVDTEAILRALRTNAQDRGASQGGSTITQQAVKILFTGGERTLTRKVREALLAYQLESRANKNDVLELYLNTVYFGQGNYGVESASQGFFGKQSIDLTLSEAALLAGLIRSPAKYSPTEHPAEALERRNAVLAKMRELGYISEAEEWQAAQRPLKLAPPREIPRVAPYFLEYVKQDLIGRFGADKVFNGGLRVYTTLDPVIQSQAERAYFDTLDRPGDPEAAIVALDYGTGHIRAMVGGRDFAEDQYNLAAQGRRQPGSAFKPFVLVTALKQKIGPETALDATPYRVKVKDGYWNVQNYEGARTAPSMTLRVATRWSVNTAYARLIVKVGPDKVVRTAREMGITSPLDANPAIALGGLRHGVTPLEMASAYGTVASGGVHLAPTGVVKVTDDRGRVLYKPEAKGRRVLTKEVAAEAGELLHDVVEAGTGTGARIGQWAAGKTGTTQEWRDAWFVGWSKPISTAVWVGHRKGQVEMTNVHGMKVTGGSLPADIWARFMREAVERAKKAPQQTEGTPKDLVKVRICRDTFLLANDRCPQPVDVYLEPQLMPERVCAAH